MVVEAPEDVVHTGLSLNSKLHVPIHFTRHAVSERRIRDGQHSVQKCWYGGRKYDDGCCNVCEDSDSVEIKLRLVNKPRNIIWQRTGNKLGRFVAFPSTMPEVHHLRRTLSVCRASLGR